MVTKQRRALRLKAFSPSFLASLASLWLIGGRTAELALGLCVAAASLSAFAFLIFHLSIPSACPASLPLRFFPLPHYHTPFLSLDRDLMSMADQVFCRVTTPQNYLGISLAIAAVF